MPEERMRADNRLEVRGLTAGYGGRKVLCGLDLCAQPGEATALLGLNGSGKSTLLRAVMGFVPAQGSVSLGGEDLLRLDERRRALALAYIPQRTHADPGLTALETVLMGANARTPLLGGYTRAQRAQAALCLKQAGADAHADTLLGELSEGQRQTVILARALMQQPRAFLLDEPDSALDLPRRYAVLRLVRRMAAENGCAALIALHDPALALNVCDRVLAIRDGRIAFAAEMRRAGREEIERGMRLLYGAVRVVRDGGAYAVLEDGDTLHSPDSLV